jgi:hypothetical protein
MPRLNVINLKDVAMQGFIRVEDAIDVVPVDEVADIAETLIREIAQGAKPRVEGLYDILEAAGRDTDIV